MDAAKSAFIRHSLFERLQQLDASATPVWGKMNGQQMVEHLIHFFDISSGKLHFPMVTPAEHLPKYLEFIYSDKQFRENTKAPSVILGEDTLPLKYPDMPSAVEALRIAVDGFYDRYAPEKEGLTEHPVFGALNLEQWILLHYKHVTHHLRQFNLMN